MQSFPRSLWLDTDGKQLVQWPVEEVESLRGKPTTVRDKVVRHGKHLEIEMYEASQVLTLDYISITTMASASRRIFELHLQDDSSFEQ